MMSVIEMLRQELAFLFWIGHWQLQSARYASPLCLASCSASMAAPRAPASIRHHVDRNGGLLPALGGHSGTDLFNKPMLKKHSLVG